jgi:F-type H+-transporting ATPase subunit alpha
MNTIDQVMMIFAGTKGHLDKVPINLVSAWEEEFLHFMREQKSEVVKVIEDSSDMSDDSISALEAAIAEFQPQFQGKHAVGEES